jgi:hypothetical protein
MATQGQTALPRPPDESGSIIVFPRDPLLLSAKSSEKGSHDTRPASPLSTLFSRDSQNEVDSEWQHFSLAKLSDLINKVSTNRPSYSANVENPGPKKSVKKIRELKVKSCNVAGGECEAQIIAKEKHADAERRRRGSHKISLLEQYRRVNDYALERAGCPPDSVKAPTKDVIMQAFNEHEDMRRLKEKLQEEACAGKDQIIIQQDQGIIQRDQVISHKNQIISEKDQAISESNQTISRKNHIIEDLSRKLQMAHNPDRQLPLSLVNTNLFNQSCAAATQDYFPFKASGPMRDQPGSERAFSTSGSSTSFTAHKFTLRTSPTSSLTSLSERFHSTESGQKKRKREEDEDDTTPTGPLRYGVPKLSIDSSPRSATSRSSRRLVEKEA